MSYQPRTVERSLGVGQYLVTPKPTGRTEPVNTSIRDLPAVRFPNSGIVRYSEPCPYPGTIGLFSGHRTGHRHSRYYVSYLLSSLYESLTGSQRLYFLHLATSHTHHPDVESKAFSSETATINVRAVLCKPPQSVYITVQICQESCRRTLRGH